MQRFKVLIIAVSLCFSAGAQTWIWDSLTMGPEKFVHFGEKYIFSYAEHASFIQRVDAKRNILWKRSFTGTFYITSAAATPDSGVVLVATFHQQATIGSVTLTSQDQDICIAKFDVNGNLSWCKTISGPSIDIAADICATPSGIYVTGCVSGVLDFCGMTVQSHSLSQGFAGKLTHAGMPVGISVASSSVNGSSFGTNIVVDNQQNVILTIKGDDVFTFAGQTFSQKHVSYLVKLDPALSYLWDMPATPPYWYIFDDNVADLAVNHANEIIYAEYTNPYARVHLISAAGSTIAAYSSTRIAIANNGNALKYDAGGKFTAIDIDSCNNVYLTGHVYKYYHHLGQLSQSVIACQMSPSLTVNWLQVVSGGTSSGISVCALRQNHCLLSGSLKGMMVLHDTLGKWYSGNPGFVGTLTTGISLLPAPVSPVCAGQSATFAVSSNAPVSWYLSGTSTVAVGIGTSIVQPVNSAGSYSIYAEARSCTQSAPRVLLTVLAHTLPVVSVNSGTICSGKAFTFQPSGASSYKYPVVTNTILAVASNTYMIIGTSAQGCSASAISAVSVQPGPQLNILGLNQICAGQQVTLTCTGASTYSWSHAATGSVVLVSPGVTTTYSVAASGSDGCEGSFAFKLTVNACSGIKDHEAGSISVYPVPSSGTIYFEPAPAMVEICDLSGRSMMIIESGTADLSGLPSGIYIARLGYGENVVLKKIVVADTRE